MPTLPLLVLTVVLAAPAWSGKNKGRVAAAKPAASAAEIPALARLLESAGWVPTPELSGGFEPGDIFAVTDQGHQWQGEGCFDAEARHSTYTSTEVVSSLQAGVRTPLAGVQAGIEKKVRFGTPVHEALPGLGLRPTDACRADLVSASRTTDISGWYVVKEVLRAEITEQTCGKLDARGVFNPLVQADTSLASACAVEALEPVAVAFRTVPVTDLLGAVAPTEAPAPAPTAAPAPAPAPTAAPAPAPAPTAAPAPARPPVAARPTPTPPAAPTPAPASAPPGGWPTPRVLVGEVPPDEPGGQTRYYCESTAACEGDPTGSWERPRDWWLFDMEGCPSGDFTLDSRMRLTFEDSGAIRLHQSSRGEFHRPVECMFGSGCGALRTVPYLQETIQSCESHDGACTCEIAKTHDMGGAWSVDSPLLLMELWLLDGSDGETGRPTGQCYCVDGDVLYTQAPGLDPEAFRRVR